MEQEPLDTSNISVEIKQIVKPRYYNTYTAEVDFMFGDADGEDTSEIELKDEATVKEFIATMNWLHSIDPHYDKLGYHQQEENVPKIMSDPRFAKFFQSWTPEDFEKDKANGDLGEHFETYAEAIEAGWGDGCYWLNEPEQMGFGPASLEEYRIFYYDVVGKKFQVLITGDTSTKYRAPLNY